VSVRSQACGLSCHDPDPDGGGGGSGGGDALIVVAAVVGRSMVLITTTTTRNAPPGVTALTTLQVTVKNAPPLSPFICLSLCLSAGNPDGMKVTTSGHVFATGPGGVLVLTPEGDHLGTILTGKLTCNLAFGDDGYVYLTAVDNLLRIKVTAQPVCPPSPTCSAPSSS